MGSKLVLSNGRTVSVKAVPVPGYQSISPPTISAVNYSQGDPRGGGQSIVITGTNFLSASAVTFLGTSASYVIDSAIQITATLPAHAAGTGNIQVTNPAGSATIAFEYWNASSLASATAWWDSFPGPAGPWPNTGGSQSITLTRPAIGGGLDGVSTGAGAGGYSSCAFAGGNSGSGVGRWKSVAGDLAKVIAEQGSGLTGSVGWVLHKPSSSGTVASSGAPYLDKAMLGTSAGGYYILSINQSGMSAATYDGTYEAAIKACTLGAGNAGVGAWHMTVHLLTTSVTQVSVDGSALASASITQNLPQSSGGDIQIGADYSGTTQYPGEIMAFGYAKASCTDAEVTKLRKWAMQRFGVTV